MDLTTILNGSIPIGNVQDRDCDSFVGYYWAEMDCRLKLQILLLCTDEIMCVYNDLLSSGLVIDLLRLMFCAANIV